MRSLNPSKNSPSILLAIVCRQYVELKGKLITSHTKNMRCHSDCHSIRNCRDILLRSHAARTRISCLSRAHYSGLLHRRIFG